MRHTKDLSKLSIDGALCISLKNRQDRREILKKEFRESRLLIEFIIVEPDLENPERGCFDSHIKCARLAIKRGYRNVLILEDDATLLAFSPRKISRMNDFIEERSPQLLYLGATLGKLWLTWTIGIARIRAKGSFAYILSADGCKQLLSYAPYTGTQIDKVFSKNFKAYGAFPFICQHQPEGIAKSNISVCRPSNGTLADERFWRRNWRRQFTQAVRNIGKTVIRRDI